MRTRLERKTMYYASRGKTMMEATISAAVDRTFELKIGKLLIFTSDGEGPLIAAKLCRDNLPRIIAVTFPAGQVFQAQNGELIRPALSDPAKRKQIESRGITIVQGTTPFQEIMIPGSSDSKLDAIVRALGLVSGSLPLCVEAILMATDAGVVTPGEEVVSASADTAIVATGALSHWLFHPEEGLDIREIVCKPRTRLVERNSGRSSNSGGKTE